MYLSLGGGGGVWTHGSECKVGRPAVIVLFGSVVTNIKADRVCFGYDDDAQCGGFGAYAIACSAISIFVALYALLTPKLRLPWGALEMKHVAAFLSVWWVVGTSCFTFIAPFTIVGNGYFGSCLATFASVSLLCRYVPKLSAALSASVAEDVGKLLCASVVNLMACVSVCSSASCINERAWALACSGVSVLVCTTVFRTKDKLPVDKISVFLSLWWMCGTGAMTFRSPFVEERSPLSVCNHTPFQWATGGSVHGSPF
mmetsp:Transcript_12423/g.29169  ORF Transcript_12423/g.29169 Transcript_12423/m.29169 type:complete len:257 (+) Transcript_12423:1-771(+)